MNMPAFTKTIRFRLAMWYVALLLIFIIIFIIGLNLTVGYLGHGKGFVEELARQIHNENATLMRNYSLISLACMVVLGGFGGYFLAGRLLKPVDRVTSLAARISSTNLKERINDEGPDDEIKRLSDTFDDMLERLEGAFESQRQFVQDASHELRTPIATALTNIEVTEMADKTTAKDYKRLMEVLKISIERMSTLSDNLLVLSDEARDEARWSSVDIAHLLDEAAQETSAKAAAAGGSLELEPSPSGMLVRGDSLRLKQVLINLVDNAIKYNRPGGWVRLSARDDGSQFVIQVQDNGIGISQADQRRIFDRFYRVDKSRSRSQGGSGLGLAIVKKIVEEHGGNIAVNSAIDKGTTFRVTLPKHIPS